MNCYTLENIVDQTICINAGNHSNVSISNCKNVYIYILKPFSEIEISKTSFSLIFVSDASNVQVQDCSNISITCYGKNLSINQVDNCYFYLYITHPIQIDKDSIDKNNLFAPYNASYNGNNPTGPNCWKLTDDNSKLSLLSPHQFTTLVIPFGSEPNGINATIPNEYRIALLERERKASERRELLLNLFQKIPNLGEKINLQIQQKFQEYISSSGLEKQLNQLNSPQIL